MTRLHLLTIACCLISACSAGVPPTPDPLRVPPPPNLTRAPIMLPQPASGRMPDLESNHRDVARLYYGLAARFCGVLAAIDAMPIDCAPYLLMEENDE
ncbi:putative gp08 [Burkholderia pseudomallei 7894]|nr:putative gp08 [Burkholderia pseudomallei 7894]